MVSSDVDLYVCTNLLDCLYARTLNLQSRHVTDVIFFDFKEAFDTVSHSKLLVKLKSYGISETYYTVSQKNRPPIIL